jgi:hypothetical protein
MRGVLLVLLGVGLAVAGCSSSSDEDDPGPGSSTPAVDQANFAALYAERFCAAQVACCTDAGGEVSASCEADVESDVAALIEEQLSLPNQEFSVSRAEACIAALDAATGCDWLDITGACGRIMVGTIAGGEVCANAGECAPPDAGYAGCAELGGATETSCRQFDSSAGEGDDCFDDRSGPFEGDEGVVVICAEGLYCSAGQCLAGAGLGESCEDSVECAEGYCYDGTCQQPALGDSCTLEGAPCAIETNCTAGECVQRPLLEQVAGTETCSVN